MVNVLHNTDIFPSWVTQTKVLPIRQHIERIETPELYRKLNTGLDQKLCLLETPAGFGKSTLLGRWRDILLDADVTVAWLNIDDSDNEASVLILNMAYALCVAGLGDVISTLSPIQFSPEASKRTMLGVVMAAITQHAGKVVLIFDDVEKLHESTVKDILLPFLQYSSQNLHMVFATRHGHHIPLSSLKIQGQVNVITANDLKFTPFELEDFFKVQLNKNMFAKIIEKTEGWPVAVQIIKTAMSGQSDPVKAIEDFNGSDHNIREYIGEQILDNIGSEQKDILLDLSILENFPSAIIALICDCQNSTVIVGLLEDLNKLIHRLDDGETYRWHPIFREAVEFYLSQTDPERMKRQYLKAADYYRGQHHFIQSIRYALLADKPEIAANILEEAGGLLLWNREGMGNIRKAHALLPESVIKTRPRLGLLRALVFLKDGHLNDARYILHRVLQETKSDPGLCSPELDYDLAVITATLAVYEGSPLSEDMCDHIRESIGRFDKEDKLQYGFVCTVLCILNFQKGEFLAARHEGEEAINFFQTHKSIFGETYIYVHLGAISAAEGKSEEAFDYYRKAQDNLRRHFIDDKDLRLVLNILMAEGHYERNDIQNAVRLLKDVNQRLENGEAWYEIYAAGYSISSAIAYEQNGLAACLDLCDDSISYIEREGLKRLRRLVAANKVGFLCRAGKIDLARNLVQESNLTFKDYNRDGGINFSVRECYGVVQALARLLIAEQRYADAIHELGQQIASHQPAYEIRAIQKYRLLLAIALYGNGDHTAAFENFAQVLIFVRTNALLRFIIDEAPFVEPLLEAYIDQADIQEKDHAQYVLNQINKINQPQGGITLSQRESQVLAQLAEGFSDKVIARNLKISINTIRFHLKNLFVKLNVNSRLMAVSEASKHKLL